MATANSTCRLAGSSLVLFAADLTGTHAAMLRDNPARIAPLTYYRPRPDWDELPRDTQLDIAERVCRRDPYQRALPEALPESDGYNGWLRLVVDVNASDAEIGRRAREIVLNYMQAVAAVHGDDLGDEA